MRAVDLELLEIIKEHNRMDLDRFYEIVTSRGSEKYYIEYSIKNMVEGGYISVSNDIINFIRDGY